MGCYPLKKMMSKAFGRCNGQERRRHSTRMMYSPPSTYSHTRVAKSVNFSSDNPVIIVPPEPNSASTIPKYYPEPVSGIPKHHPEPDISPSAHAPTSSNSTGPENAEPKVPKVPNRTRFGPGPDMPADSVHPTPARREPTMPYHGHGPVHGYVPSPLPMWEDRPRRREYFSGEYYYYPTPIREGIYNIATDPSRLTNMFSEENPNACTIV